MSQTNVLMNDLTVTEPPCLQDKRVPSGYLSKRYVLVLLVHLGLALTSTIHQVKCVSESQNASDTRLWYFYAHLLVRIPAGIISYKFSATALFGFYIFSSIIVSFLTVILNAWNTPTAEILALLQGILQGAIYPAFGGIWRYWAPPSERSTLITLGYSGAFSGILIGCKLSDTFCNLLTSEKILFVYAVMGVGWYLLWWWSVYEHPSQHPTITEKELAILMQTIDSTNEKPPIQWKQMLTSTPVWALLFAVFSRSCSLYHYQYSGFNFNNAISNRGWGDPLVFITVVMLVSIVLAGCFADCLLKSTIVPKTMLRKIYISGGFLTSFLVFLTFAYPVADAITNDVFRVGFIYMVYWVMMAGCYANHLDIAPRYAGITISLASFLAAIPISIPRWFQLDYNNSWFIRSTLSVHVLGAVIFWFFGSSREQTWAKPIQNKTEEQQGSEN